MQNDMTVGNPMKIILSFTLPIFIGNVLPWLHLYDSKVGAWRNAPDPRPNGPRAGGRYAREARGSLPSVAPFARNISLISLLF